MECPKCKAENGEDLAVCSECQTPLTSKQAKKKVCFLVKLQIYCISAIILLLIAVNFLVNDFISSIVVSLAYFLLIIQPFLAIAALIRISLNSEQVKGRGFAILILVISCFFLYQDAYYNVPRAEEYQGPRSIVCKSNLKVLGMGLFMYASENNDMLPSENWCGQLIGKYMLDVMNFHCPRSDTVEGESSYCLNNNAAGKNLSELPSDMVLCFDTAFSLGKGEKRVPIKNRKLFNKPNGQMVDFDGDEKVYLTRWNQIGGPERLAVDRHGEYRNILFADGHVESVKLSKISELNWGGDGSKFNTGDYMEQQVKSGSTSIMLFKVVSLGSMGIICVLFTVWTFVKFKAIKHWKFVSLIGLLSAGTGWFFGNASEAAYFSMPKIAGDISGIIYGLLVGVCFAAIISGCYNKLKHHITFVDFTFSVGMLTGMLCSTLVHVSLMIVFEETNPYGIEIGMPFGIGAGAALGAISGFVIKKCYSEEKGNSNEVA